MLPLLPIAGSAVAGLGYAIVKIRKAERLKGVMTPTRERIYHEALNSLRGPSDLRSLAVAFLSEGLHEQAELLKKRAAIKELPETTRLKRRQVLKAALGWRNPDNVNALAKAFDDVGANGAAALLRRYAAGLQPDADKNADTIPVPAVRRRRINSDTVNTDTVNTDTVEANMVINPFPAASIPGALNNPNAPPNDPGIPTPQELEHNPAFSPDGLSPAAPTGDPVSAAIIEGDGGGDDGGDDDSGGDADGDAEPGDVTLTVTESSDPDVPNTVTVESDDPENTEVTVTETATETPDDGEGD
jgi:hypothetical protein